MSTTYTLNDLPGMEGPVEAMFVEHPDDAVAELGHGAPAVTSAGDDGAINIWLAPDGFHCERYAYCVTKASAVVPNLTAVSEWVRAEWPKIGRLDVAAGSEV
jgi:hypothetical protein